MFRYIATAVIAALLLAVALKSRHVKPAGGAEGALTIQERPEVDVQPGPAGDRQVTVTHRMLGAVSRASLVYELQGEEKTCARRTDCERSLGDPSFRDGGSGYTTEVVLTGTLPRGASDVRLVLEAETGTTVLPVELN